MHKHFVLPLTTWGIHSVYSLLLLQCLEQEERKEEED